MRQRNITLSILPGRPTWLYPAHTSVQAKTPLLIPWCWEFSWGQGLFLCFSSVALRERSFPFGKVGESSCPLWILAFSPQHLALVSGREHLVQSSLSLGAGNTLLVQLLHGSCHVDSLPGWKRVEWGLASHLVPPPILTPGKWPHQLRVWLCHCFFFFNK